MKTTWYYIVFIILSFSFIVLPKVSGATLVYGTVTVLDTGKPITGARVRQSKLISTTTSSTGSYSLNLAPGKYTLAASYSGFVTQAKNVTIGTSAVKLDFSLSYSPPPEIESVYPSLGELGQPLSNVQIQGNGFESSTRLSMYLDLANKAKVTGSVQMPGGGAVAVTKIGTTAYVAGGSSGLHVVDVSNPLKPVTISSLNLSCQANDVYVADNTAYVACGSAGLKVVNVSDPAHLDTNDIIGTRDTPGIANAVTVQDSKAFVADGSSGLQVINLAAPSLPIDDSFGTTGLAFSVAVVGNFAYVAAGDLVIFDLDRLAVPNPVVVDLAGANDVAVKNGKAYVSCNTDGLHIVDVSNPALPVKKGSAETPYAAYGVTISENKAFVTVGDTWEFNSAGLIVFNVETPSEPVKIGTLFTAAFRATDAAVIDSIAYLTDDSGYLHVIDARNLASPDLPTEKTPAIANNVTVAGARAYVTDGTGLHVVDISDPLQPSIIGSVATPNAQSVTVVGDKAYLADGTSGLKVIDVSDPYNLDVSDIIGAVDTPNFAQGIFVTGNRAYVADGTSGLQVIDVSDPYNLDVTDIIGSRDTPNWARDVAVFGNYAYVANDASGLLVIDINNPTLPIVGSETTMTGPSGYAVAITIIDGIAYVIVKNGNSTLYLVNISNPTQPVIMGEVYASSTASDVFVTNDVAYIACDSDGLKSVDVSDPTQPVLIGSIDALDVNAASVTGSTAYIADYNKGFVVAPAPVKLPSFTVNNATKITATLPDPKIAGNYTLRVYNNAVNHGKLFGAVTFTDEIKLLSSKAIIVAGGGPAAGNNIWTETKAYANQAYDNLIYQGYKHEDIYYITDQYQPLHDRYDPQIIQQYANVKEATRWHLWNAIANWAKSGGTSDLLIFMEDHGETERFLMRGGTSPLYVTADELDDWLDDLQNSLPGKVILVYDACHSGSFIAKLTPPAGKIRLTLTSSTPDQVAFFLESDHSFSSHFWSTFSGKSGNKAIVSEALNRAANTMASYQTAQLDADGDGVPNQPDDYAALEGHEGTIYALRRQYYYKDRSKPVIGVVSGDKTLNSSTSAQLNAANIFDIDGDSITRVWAEIYAPDFNPDITGQTVITLPGITLNGPVAGAYQATYTGFTKRGTYIITYYAEDSSGIYSLPETSLVKQTGGTIVVVPDQYEVDDTYPGANVIVVNNPSPQNHSFHAATDADWVKFYAIKNGWYTIKAAQPTIISDPIIQIYGSNGTSLLMTRNNGGSGVEEKLSWQCPASGMYYVRLTNNSSHYGANVRYKLKVYNPYAFSLPGYVKGKVSAGGSGVAGAALYVGNGSTAVSQGDGSYLMSLPAGSYGVNVSKAGYQPTSFSVSVPSGGSATRNVSLTSNFINVAPTINGSPLTTTYTYEWYSFAPTAADPNGDKLTFSITGKPGWASFNTNTGVLSGLPTLSHIGSYGPYTISVSDGKKSASLPAFTINVEEGSNLPPIIGGNPSKLAGAERLYSFMPMYSDPNGDSLTFSITNTPGWASFVGGKLSGIPGKVNLGKTFGPITIKVTDPKGAFATLPGFIIQVVPNREVNKFGVLPGVYLLLRK